MNIVIADLTGQGKQTVFFPKYKLTELRFLPEFGEVFEDTCVAAVYVEKTSDLCILWHCR